MTETVPSHSDDRDRPFPLRRARRPACDGMNVPRAIAVYGAAVASTMAIRALAAQTDDDGVLVLSTSDTDEIGILAAALDDVLADVPGVDETA